MSKYDNQLSRMSYLMGYEIPKNSLNESKKKSVEFHKEGADGNVYGIIREGRQFVIKKTSKGKENLRESYDYINGYMRKNENTFDNYNTATKHLESMLMNINESYGVHEDVSVVDFNKNKKALDTLTEEARKELDRMHQIFENSTIIGQGVYRGEDPERKGKAETPKKQGDPYTQEAKYSENGAEGSHSTPESANKGYDTVSYDKADKELTGADKFPGKANADSGKIKDHTPIKSDLTGEGLADKGKETARKVVKINESLDEINTSLMGGTENYEDDDIEFADFEDELTGVEEHEEEPELTGVEEYEKPEKFEIVNEPNEEGLNDEVVDEDLDTLINEYYDIMNECDCSDDSCICDGDDETLKNYKYGNVDMPKKGNVTVWNHMDNDTLDESRVDRITKMVMESIVNEIGKPETDEKPQNDNDIVGLEEAIDRIVAEEVTRLNVWGKHPRYGKQPMTLPDNKEVLAGTADRDFNDDSAKGNERYGKKIGDSAPFNKIVELVTDSVMSALNESLKKK